MFNKKGNIIYLEEDITYEEPYIDLNPISNPNLKYLKEIFNPDEDSFVDFLIRNLMKTVSNSKNNNIILTHWLEEYFEWKNSRDITDESKDIVTGTKVISKITTGNIKSLLQLSFDVYCLQIQRCFPNQLRNRLQLIDQFQGAKYEIAVASLLLRAGFTIKYDDPEISNIEGKSCEFVAIHRVTNDKIGIEAKSKKYRGVLNSPGGKNVDEIKDNFMGGLLSKAKKQRPSQLPFIIFLDSNLPPSENLHLGEITYFDELSNLIKGDYDSYINSKRQTPYNDIIITNFSDHYLGSDFAPENVSFCTFHSEYPLYNINGGDRIYTDLINSLKNYTKGINLVTNKILREKSKLY